MPTVHTEEKDPTIMPTIYRKKGPDSNANCKYIEKV